MLKSKKCNSCKFYCSKMFEDMGASSDGCKFYEKYLHLDWTMCLFHNTVDDNLSCPFYDKKTDFISQNICDSIVRCFSDLFDSLGASLVKHSSGLSDDDSDDDVFDDDEV